jgi:hypothetical protein
MSEYQAREWQFYIADMILFSEKVIAYTMLEVLPELQPPPKPSTNV